ncbi:hydantoinase/carbamoylase family amidase [Ornithinibacillus sp. L9]|uniref:Hydantoinase/carbamoylase family amidase n=1 Tax=Ornithinibacillus caprae TaxID=2678566 RepID=A0A6N8FGP0_9BACI|nr:M20 family metallo-hydrolase [Ornithinibacillus caprae]MUK88822.1 hydantoinase/carbamoylase family amidase [Ornithinibacillus caprae]
MSTFNLEKKLMDLYDGNKDYEGVSGSRLAHRLGEISKIGLTTDYGSNRPGFSYEEKQAKELVMKWMREAGLEVRMDGAGNVIGRLEGKKDLPAILSGSHVDSVPNGGHFDGPLGVLSALEVVEAWKETGYQPEKPFEVVIFTDEEGARFNGGFGGSEAMLGTADIDEKQKQVDTNGLTFAEVLEEIGLTVDGYAASNRNLDNIEMFVEVHIEQGKRLEKENLPCGIVTGIAGPCWLEFTFIGEAGHAGNTPMNDRKDALVAASEFIQAVHKLPSQFSDSAVATVGKIQVEPNGVNVIPGAVTLFVDIRDIYKNTRDALIEAVIDTGKSVGKKHHVAVTSKENMRVNPVPIEEETQKLLERSFKEKGIRPYKLPSGAGHDAMVVGEKLPIAMLFVQSKDGISHNPAEWSELKDCVETVHVLKQFVESLQV